MRTGVPGLKVSLNTWNNQQQQQRPTPKHIIMKFQKPGNKSKQKPQKGHTQKPRNYNVIKLNSDTGD